MKQRRTLVDGLTETPDVELLEKQFVYGEKDESPSPKSGDSVQSNSVPDRSEVMPQFKGRVPLTTRCRPELASALKRASLERQLRGQEPNRMQDILEEALFDWLRAHDYAELLSN